MKARICIIGNGSFANMVHLPSLMSFEDVEILAIFAYNKEKLLQTAARYGVNPERVYSMDSPTAYQQHLLQMQPDGVYAIGQPEQMLPVWYWCLQQGFNLYIEKPLGLTWHQAKMLTYLAEENNCITQVSLQRRSSPILQYMRDKCLERGDITQGMVSFSKYDIKPMFGARDKMLDDFIHCVDTARWLCNSEVVKVEAKCKSVLTPDVNWIGAALHFANDAICYAVGNWSSGRRIFKVEMHSPGICAEVEPEKDAYLYADGDYVGKHFDAKVIAGSQEFFIYGGFQQKNREFIDSVRSGVERTSSPFKDVLKTMKVCENILAQTTLF